MTTPKNIDKYQIIKPLGSGHFGQVFHAFDRALMTEKAIKVLKVTDPQQFLQHLEEAQILRACTHKHIVTINEANVFPVNGEHRVVLDLEYISEGSLEGAMEGRWVSAKEAISYIRGTISGLEHAHAQGILHRDIKPGNILLAPHAAKLSDFGLATSVQPGQAGSAKGYVTHLAPEYFISRETTQQTDIFAMGATLYRSVCNLSEWRAITSAIPKKMAHIKKGTLIKEIGYPDFVPSQLRRIINKACAPDPANRYKTATEFGQRLDALRFAVDWLQENDFDWAGSDGTHHYEAYIDPAKNILTVKKNGRRLNGFCKQFSSLDDAVVALHEHVATSTLA